MDAIARKLEAIRLLSQLTSGRCDLWHLAGNYNAKVRAQLLGVLLGTKVPTAKAGVNALESAFYSACGIEGNCGAEKDENFRNFCKGMLSGVR